ncbi:hypothetical protein DD559_02835 [Sphingomonas pokkalii]|uniref:Uncharacterized protein n=2 Tax=Sphingomonas pokkalii TaxID=2175090 RepID=A0A2U0SAI9_9SPHN|nr:hypothetical protein DD559_02835 [Sphingomonas pokkalii]
MSGGNEHRDRLLSDRVTGSVLAGIAYQGFSLSAWGSKELSTGRGAREILFGYSHKLPAFDLHGALVACSNDRLPGGCSDGVRLTATTNFIRGLTVEAVIDVALASSRRAYSAAVTRDVWHSDETSGSVRLGWTRTDYGAGVHLDGTSCRLIAERRLGQGLALDFSAGAAWTSGRARLAEGRDGVFASTSLVWRY